jgi:hypothetical protein
VDFYGFFVEKTIKMPIIGHPFALCRVKNRPKADFWGIYARSATNC